MTRAKAARRVKPPPKPKPPRTPLPSTNADNDRDAVAHHEAAHAVFYVVLGLPFEAVGVGSKPFADMDGGALAFGDVAAPDQPADGVAAAWLRFPPDDNASAHDAAWYLRHAIGTAAGNLAEIQRRAERWPDEPEYRRLRWRDRFMQSAGAPDAEAAEALLARYLAARQGTVGAESYAVRGNDLARLFPPFLAVAEALLLAAWPAVGAVAEALLERGTLTGADVSAMVTETLGAGVVDSVDAALAPFLAVLDEPEDDA